MAVTNAKRLNVENAIIETRAVGTGVTVRQGMPVVLSSGNIVEADSDDDAFYGIAYISEDGVWPAAAGDLVQVILRGSPCVAPVRVAAAGLAAGAFAVPASGGVIAAVFTDGTNPAHVVGQHVEDAAGVSGDLVGINLSAQGFLSTNAS